MTIMVPMVVQVFISMMAIRAMLGPLIQSQTVRLRILAWSHSGPVRRVMPNQPRMIWKRPCGSLIQAIGSQRPKVSTSSTWLINPFFW